VAAVGLDERQAAARGIDGESRSLALENAPCALANYDHWGFIELVAERESGRSIGARIVASGGGEMIQALSSLP